MCWTLIFLLTRVVVRDDEANDEAGSFLKEGVLQEATLQT